MKRIITIFLFLQFLFTNTNAQIICTNCYNQTAQLSPAAGNLVLNPSFETNGGNGAFFCPNSGSYAVANNIANWTCTGGASGTYAQIFGAGSTIVPQGVAAVYMGNWYCNPCSATANDTSCLIKTGCEITGIPAGFPINDTAFGGTTGVSLSQTVSGLVVGNKYVLEFWTGGEGGGWPDPGMFGLNIGFGVNMLTCMPTTSGSGATGIRYEIQFRATATSHTIEFTNWGHLCQTCTELIVDDVKLYPIAQLNPLYPPCASDDTTIYLCPGETYTLSNGTILSLPGTYTDTFTNVVGLDSIITIAINAGQTLTVIRDTLCNNNETHTLPDNTVTSTAGTYVHTFTNIHGCDSIINTVITKVNLQTTISNDTTYCTPGVPFTLSATGGTNILWSSSTGALPCGNCYSQVLTPSSSTNYYATFSESGCIARDTVKVRIFPFNTFFNVSDQSLCQGQQVIFTSQIIGAGASGTLNLGNGVVVNQTPLFQYNYPTPGTYIAYLLAKDTLGCKDSLVKIINVYGRNNLDFTVSDTNICLGQPIFINDTISPNVNSFSYDFMDGTIIQNLHNPMHVYESIGTYIIELRGKNAECPDSVKKQTVVVNNYPTVNLGEDVSICPGIDGPITLQNTIGTPATSYLWSNGSVGSSLPTAEPNLYWLQVTYNECSTTDTILVARDCYINIPNAFTPGTTDELNAYFFPRELLSKGVTTFSMKIYNRWGNEVFNTTNINGRGWDGLFGAKPQPMGVYVYNIRVSFENGEVKNYTGNVTLIR